MNKPESNDAAERDSGSLQRACYAAGERVMAKHARWGWIPATVRWQNITSVAVITDHGYMVTIPMEDVKPHNDQAQRPPAEQSKS